MNQKKNLSVFFFVFVCISFIFAEAQTYEKLLEHYLSNDRSLKEVALQYEQAVLSYQKTQVQNAIALTLSSGTAQVLFDKDETKLSFSPSANLSIPEFQNAKLDARVPLSIPLEKDAKVSINDAGLSLSIDLVSSVKKNRELVLKKAEENLLDAKLKKEAKILSLTKEFLQTFKSIYSLQANVLSQEENALTKETDLVLLKAQGFEDHSARYRLAYLSWQSVLRDYEEAQRNFEKAVFEFSGKCGVEKIDFSIEIPKESLFSIKDFEKNDFTQIKASLLSYENNKLSEDAKTPFQLGLNAAYGFSMSEHDSNMETSNTLSSGLSFKKDGFSASLGMQNKLEDLETPRFTFSLAYSFAEQKLAKISNEEAGLQEKIFVSHIENAQEQYDATVNEKEKQKDDLLWQLQKNKDQESLYADLAKDMKSWFEKGIISETEYKQALANYTKASTQVHISEIECLIYNIDIALLFF